MQLDQDTWIEGAYYLDFDSKGQLRIVGPENHLYFGSAGLSKQQISINSVESQKHLLKINGTFLGPRFFLPDPIIGHIRRVRQLVGIASSHKLSFAEILKKDPDEIVPNFISLKYLNNNWEISYKRLYGKNYYGVKITLPKQLKVKRADRQRGFMIEGTKDKQIPFCLITLSSRSYKPEIKNIIKLNYPSIKLFGKNQSKINKLLDRTEAEINHLVMNNKTSGFDYGTVFPRDWMESIDLGMLDLTPEALSYMLHKALEFVNEEGVGWHENIIGEFEHEKQLETKQLNETLNDLIGRTNQISKMLKKLITQAEELYIRRNMIDIEPHYILALRAIDIKTINSSDMKRLKKVAQYIIKQAETNDLIFFKKLPPLMRHHKYDEYYNVGNWRDSDNAFKEIHPVLAPYDVNAVFYPQALNIIYTYAAQFGLERKKIKPLIKKWSRVKNWYKFKNEDGLQGYALALYDVADSERRIVFQQLEVNHLDEAYDLYYGFPTRLDVESFCLRLLSSKYFYTPSGPTIVGKFDGYNSKNYHGLVIWTKQTAFTVAGLLRQLNLAKKHAWPSKTHTLFYTAIKKTAIASINAFVKLEAVPELHYDRAGEPDFYHNQSNAEGIMNKVQLWSAVGARRIIRAICELEE